MEVIAKYGSVQQKKEWLQPLLDGKIRSAFLMTERAVASSDAKNISMSCVREGDELVLNGSVWLPFFFTFFNSFYLRTHYGYLTIPNSRAVLTFLQKWWSSGAGDPRCKVYITVTKTDPNNPDPYKQQR